MNLSKIMLSIIIAGSIGAVCAADNAVADAKKEYSEVRNRLNRAPYSSEYGKLEKSVLLANADYAKLHAADIAAEKEMNECLFTEVAKFPEYTEKVARIRELDKKLAEPSEKPQYELAKERNVLFGELRKAGGEKGVTKWGTEPHTGKVRNKQKTIMVKFVKGIELLAASENADAKAFAAAYKADQALAEKLKNAK